MYGSQVWGTQYLRRGHEFKVSVQKCHPAFLEKLSYNGFRPSAKWVDCCACWAMPARQSISILRKKKVICRTSLSETIHIHSTDVVNVKSACVTIVSPNSEISKLFCALGALVVYQCTVYSCPSGTQDTVRCSLS